MPWRYPFIPELILALLSPAALNSSSRVDSGPKRKRMDAAYYLKANPHAGEVISDIVFRVIASMGTAM